MRPACLTVEAVIIFCPYCKEVIPEAGGSEFWTRDEVQMREQARCHACGRDVRIPKPKTVKMFM